MSTATTARDTRRKTGAARRKTGTPAVTDDILTRASAVVGRLAAEYPTHALRDIHRLTRLADRMTAESDVRAVHYREISAVAHDIRGQGALFGYPLITRCADSLCRAVRALDPDDSAAIGLIQTHAVALRAILRAGAGAPPGRSTLFVTAGLELLVLLRTRYGRR